MNDKKSPEVKEAEDYVTPEQVNEYYKEIKETFGKIEIVSEGKSITDLLGEQEEKDKK